MTLCCSACAWSSRYHKVKFSWTCSALQLYSHVRILVEQSACTAPCVLHPGDKLAIIAVLELAQAHIGVGAQSFIFFAAFRTPFLTLSKLLVSDGFINTLVFMLNRKEVPEVNDHILGSQNNMFRLCSCVDCQQEYTHL